MDKLIIAVDGPAASGKGTLARKLADRFGFTYLDTGKLYRLIGLQLFNTGKNPDDPAQAAEMAAELKKYFRPEDLENPDLSRDDIGNYASRAAVHPALREELVSLQRNFPEQIDVQGVVIDGRDIGTIIFPDAHLKFFVTAQTETRAKRRYEELKKLGRDPDYEEILNDMKERDSRDSGRAHAPTKKAPDAIELDTTNMSIDEMVEQVSPVILRAST